jgi:DNA-binding NtrC family response regulator
VYGRFVEMHALLFAVPGLTLDVPGPGVLFALLYQVRRAYFVILTTLRGISAPMARLQASVWNAIFAGDLLRYTRWKYAHMGGTTTLILGDTGTGKELVARALAFARYLPFDEAREAFAARAGEGFHAVNISGLAVALADSLLFGHKKGAFTGALEDAPGALALCVRGVFLFLDEVGDLDPSIQVKLLRVLEEAKYRPVGANKEQEILGTLIFATQPARLRGPAMRRDLRYRIYKNVIRTPSLRVRLDDHPEELPLLVRLLAEEEAGPDAGAVTEETLAVIHTQYQGYDWPGNVRELKACVENVASQHEYTPPYSLAPGSLRAPKSLRARQPPANDLAVESPGTELARAVLRAEISFEDLRERYILHSFAQTGSYTETAERLGIDRRTVRAVVEAAGASPPEGRAGQRRRGGRG